MSLLKVLLTTLILTETDNSYSLNGMMNPHFFNEGKSTVVINHQEVLPGDIYPVQFEGMVLSGTINIKFKDEIDIATGEQKLNKLVLNYGMVVGEIDTSTEGASKNNQGQSQGYGGSCS
ncbi:hypothetical protein [Maribacter sp.]|uniref:hypothetical protein n=1 Tax=Maribacter sp. TaxID=1897614 RepID=UPI0025BCE31A|nr:hypothetical protein [Maribacter sp.]